MRQASAAIRKRDSKLSMHDAVFERGIVVVFPVTSLEITVSYEMQDVTNA